MEEAGYQVTDQFEATHWWFRARRCLFLSQVRRASQELSLGKPSILDYGCGTGFNLCVLREFGQVTGADAKTDRILPYWKAGDTPLIDLAQPSAEQSRGKFDIVVALDVLEHISDDVAGLNDILSYLKPGGQAILTVPAYQWLWSGEDEISEHKRRYTRSMLLKVIRQVPAEIRFMSYFNLSILPLMAGAIYLARLFLGRGNRRSNLSHGSSWANEILYWVTSTEAGFVGKHQLRIPAGASIVCRLKKI